MSKGRSSPKLAKNTLREKPSPKQRWEGSNSEAVTPIKSLASRRILTSSDDDDEIPLARRRASGVPAPISIKNADGLSNLSDDDQPLSARVQTRKTVARLDRVNVLDDLGASRRDKTVRGQEEQPANASSKSPRDPTTTRSDSSNPFETVSNIPSASVTVLIVAPCNPINLPTALSYISRASPFCFNVPSGSRRTCRTA